MPSNASVIIRAELPMRADMLNREITSVTMTRSQMGRMDSGRSTHLAVIRDLLALGTNAMAVRRS